MMKAFYFLAREGKKLSEGKMKIHFHFTKINFFPKRETKTCSAYKICPAYICILTTTLAVLFFMFVFSYPPVFAEETIDNQNAQNVTKNARVDTTSAGLLVKVAPGELLPISIKLSNFGGGKKVDVIVTYGIFNSKGTQIYITTETVAVETTSSFVKTIQIPFGTLPGKYIAKTSIIYKDQLVPATTQFPFIVENKIIGLFQSDFFLYGGITAFISVMMVFLGYIFVKRQKATRLAPFDYSDIPHDKRIYFELLSDTIMQMRLRVGDTALDIAAHIDGLTIDEKTGRVLEITKRPSKIIALLVSRYDKVIGQKVNFSFRKM